MIRDHYLLYVCPDPECERWEVDPGRCDDHHAHPLGDYPELRELVVYPSESEVQADKAERASAGSGA